ncbi:glycosyl hydrolase family 18 protein [Kineosporia rhizophila]|uniref:glycosyl hydrolase family 18 protein n=1 Tax=Kineosporia rhizophila TaxID=84633 RepID=UPI000AEFF58F|nr:glycosyl hydrolase family 18 protein [Kineosporia rhizophila]
MSRHLSARSASIVSERFSPRSLIGTFSLLVAVATLALTTVLGSGPASAAPTLPTHLLTGYWQNFVNGAKPLKLADVPRSYGIVAVSFADAVPSRAGAIDFTLDSGLASALGGYTDAQFKADVATLKSRGQKVIISVGGQNGTISLPNAAAATAFADTTYALMQEYGFDGVDIDLENAPNLTQMTAALRSLAGKAGSGFVLTMAPETIYVQPGGSYLQLIDQVKDLITVVNTQYYNSGSMIGRDGKVYSSGTVDFQTALADILLDGHLRADQVGLGLPATTSAAGSGYVNPSVVNNALDCLTRGTNCGSYKPASTYPTLRGAMTWSINWDASNGYNWANTVGGHLPSLPGGGTNPPTTPPTTTPPTTPPTTTNPPTTGCNGVAAWSATTAYNGGAKVTYNQRSWTAKWWTYGDKPGANAQNVWVDNGAC